MKEWEKADIYEKLSTCLDIVRFYDQKYNKSLSPEDYVSHSIYYLKEINKVSLKRKNRNLQVDHVAIFITYDIVNNQPTLCLCDKN